jgi:hypothetical protein
MFGLRYIIADCDRVWRSEVCVVGTDKDYLTVICKLARDKERVSVPPPPSPFSRTPQIPFLPHTSDPLSPAHLRLSNAATTAVADSPSHLHSRC